MKFKKILFSLFVLSIIFSVIVSGAWNFYTPSDFFENEWISFGVLFVLFFALVYFAVNKSVNNAGVASIIALAISFFITSAIARKTYITDFIGGWGVFFAVLVVIGLLIKLSYDHMGSGGTFLTLTIVFIAASSVGIETYLPYEIGYTGFGEFLLTITSFPISWVIGIILIVITIFMLKKHGFSSGRKTVAERIFGERR